MTGSLPPSYREAAIEAGATSLQRRWELEGVDDPLTGEYEPLPWETLEPDDQASWISWSTAVVDVVVPVILEGLKAEAESDDVKMARALHVENMTGALYMAYAFIDRVISYKGHDLEQTELLGEIQRVLDAGNEPVPVPEKEERLNGQSIDDLADELEDVGYRPIADRLRDGRMTVAAVLAFLRRQADADIIDICAEPIRILKSWGEPMNTHTSSSPANEHVARMKEIGSRLAVDTDGYVWWVHADGSHSMVRTNPDNKPTPMPFTFFEPVPKGYAVRRKSSTVTTEDWEAS
jgi:hypothetical protein